MDNESELEQQEEQLPLEQPIQEVVEEDSPIPSPPQEKGVDAEEIALETMRETMGNEDDIVVLSNGYRVRYCPVPQNAIVNASQKIKDPNPPLKPHPTDPNRAPVSSPDDPEYLAKLRENEQKRSDAVQDILFGFGLELVDPLPEDEKWMHKLALVGLIDRDKIADADELQKELWFKKYMVANDQVYFELGKKLGISEEGVAQIRAAFKSNP